MVACARAQTCYKQETMQIDFTKEQFKRLLQLAYLGNWLINANRTDMERARIFDELQSHIFGQAEKFEMGELAKKTPKGTQPSDAFEKQPELERLIDEYDDDAFWDGLVERLAHRDFERMHGICPDEAPLPEDLAHSLHELEDRYERVFAEHGLERLEALQTIEDLMGPDA